MSEGNTPFAVTVGIAIFLTVAVNAIIGGTYIGIHAECQDGIDNDNDNGMIDVHDPDCASYPYADGNGESPTPIVDRYTEDSNPQTLDTYRIWAIDWVLENWTPNPHINPSHIQNPAGVCFTTSSPSTAFTIIDPFANEQYHGNSTMQGEWSLNQAMNC